MSEDCGAVGSHKNAAVAIVDRRSASRHKELKIVPLIKREFKEERGHMYDPSVLKISDGVVDSRRQPACTTCILGSIQAVNFLEHFLGAPGFTICMPQDWGLSQGSGLGWILVAHPHFSISSSSSGASSSKEPVHSSQNHSSHSLQSSLAHPPCVPSAVWVFRSLVDRIPSAAGAAPAINVPGALVGGRRKIGLVSGHIVCCWWHDLSLLCSHTAGAQCEHEACIHCAQNTISAPTPAHDANLVTQQLSATILHALPIRARALAIHPPSPPGRLPFVRRSYRRTGDGETSSCGSSAAVWISFVGEPSDPAFLFQLSPTDPVNAGPRAGHIIALARSTLHAQGSTADDTAVSRMSFAHRVAAALTMYSSSGSTLGSIQQQDIVCGLPTQRIRQVCARLAAAHHLRDIHSGLHNVGGATDIRGTLGAHNGGRRCRFSYSAILLGSASSLGPPHSWHAQGVPQDIVYAIAKSHAGTPSTPPSRRLRANKISMYPWIIFATLADIYTRNEARHSEGDCAGWLSTLASTAAASLPGFDTHRVYTVYYPIPPHIALARHMHAVPQWVGGRNFRVDAAEGSCVLPRAIGIQYYPRPLLSMRLFVGQATLMHGSYAIRGTLDNPLA
ncbi:hypothetical protein C8J57DRAFT_1477197 [Mycena rebaudengoi]|nr:hypothetical protein C8J57DRAFT_1477197 [Mycena rebaudengoi]